jgi:signal transduction histidine kinase/ligand-binding sensor domain-containing protein/DNA-binding response OmpR family regulator
MESCLRMAKNYIFKSLYKPGVFIAGLILLLIFLDFAPASAQSEKIFFSNINVNHGLSDNAVKCIYRDSKGFMWFGTNSGLNRFDGYEFEIFRSEASDSSTLSDNVINVITGSSNGDLWIGTRTGISILDGTTSRFRRLYLKPSPPDICQDINYITALAEGPEGSFLAGTHNGLFVINRDGNTISHMLFDKKSCSSPVNNITSIVSDNNGSYWAGTAGGFIIKFRPGSGSVEKLEAEKDDEPSGEISKILADRNSSLWAADRNGLHLYNTIDKEWDKGFRNLYGKRFANLQVTGIVEDNHGQIWVSTDGKGAYIFDSPGREPLNITSLPYAKGSLSGNGLTSLYCDREGIVWIGNSRRGVDFYKENIVKFSLYQNYPTNENSLSNNDVNCITEDRNGAIWIGTNGGGLNRYDRKLNSFTHFRAYPGSLSSNIIVSVLESSDGMIWAGTYMGGLNRLDPETGIVKVYRNDPADSASLSDDRVWDIREDQIGNLWIATLTGGLNYLDVKTGKFRRFNSGNSALCFNYLNSISIDESGNLWISSANGLIYFDPANNRSECYYSNTASEGSLSDNQVISTFEDCRGLFWVCTNNGLNLMDRTSKTFRVFREADGLPSHSILRILEDRDSCLWVSSRNGLSKMIVTYSDSYLPEVSFINYGMKDGLQGKEFSETAAWAGSDGKLWFGGTEGLNAFMPKEIKMDPGQPVLVFTGLRIDNIPVAYGEVINSRVLLDKPVYNTSEIILKYRENSFTIDFAALNYFFPETVQYSFNLEGFNDKWIFTKGAENYATFSNLDNGTYTFNLRGTNTDGIWSSNQVKLKIKVLPPIWKSWYAYFVYVSMILALLALLRWITVTRERMRMQLEHEQMESRHIHEIDSLKIRFFTNISHELRTPLSLILSPAEKLKSQWKEKPEEKQINLIIQNARRLLFMVNQLLDFRKMEVQGFGYNPSLGDIIGFIRKSVSSFDDLAEQKQITLSFRSDRDELVTFFDRPKLEKIIFNLLSNSFKFTHNGGTINVTTGAPDGVMREEVEIIVEDTGIGVPADKIGNLFTSFYQVDSGLSDQGTGLGLALVKEFVKLHDGNITVQSEVGRGSRFTIVIPVRRESMISEGVSNDSLQPDSANTGAKRFREKPKILIAEDDDDLRFYLKDNLKGHYNVFECSNGTEAAGVINKIMPDLVISDIIMPGMDGIELCRLIKSDIKTSSIPVILLTGKAREEVQLQGLETGADDYITKPFNFQLLDVRITNLINTRLMLRETSRNSNKLELSEPDVISLDEQFLRKALELIETNISNTDYTVEELSRDMGLSRTLLYKKVLTLTGKPPLEFIRSLRLKRAARLLGKSQLNVSEVAFRVGFNDPKYFRKHFKNEYGMLPSAYAEKNSKAAGQPD